MLRPHVYTLPYSFKANVCSLPHETLVIFYIIETLLNFAYVSAFFIPNWQNLLLPIIKTSPSPFIFTFIILDKIAV